MYFLYNVDINKNKKHVLKTQETNEDRVNSRPLFASPSAAEGAMSRRFIAPRKNIGATVKYM
jgi:hypothetical protein